MSPCVASWAEPAKAVRDGGWERSWPYSALPSGAPFPESRRRRLCRAVPSALRPGQHQGLWEQEGNKPEAGGGSFLEEGTPRLA